MTKYIKFWYYNQMTEAKVIAENYRRFRVVLSDGTDVQIPKYAVVKEEIK
jgi:hypothetical protein